MHLNLIYNEEKYQNQLKEIDKIYKKNNYIVDIEIIFLVFSFLGIVIAEIFSISTKIFAFIMFGPLIMTYVMVYTCYHYTLKIEDKQNALEELSWFHDVKTKICDKAQKDNHSIFAKSMDGKWLILNDDNHYESLSELLSEMDYNKPIPEQFNSLTLELKEDNTINVYFS